MLALACVLLGAVSTFAQIRPSPTPPPPEPPAGPSKPDSSSTDFGSPESEMRAKLALKADKKQYDENVARAREVADLATQLSNTYEAKALFDSTDSKKLERLEKLTKKIRNEAGGSDTDPETKDIPAGMLAVVKRVAEVADDLRKLVETTPRHVISASVIDQSNKLLGLIQHLRVGRP
jgi:Mg/Co/Ni transporter MgtE